MVHFIHFAHPVHHKKSTAMDMTSGSITKLLLLFALPLLLGNLFQQFYNTVDVLVVGNFVGKEALAAVGSTTVIINTLVLFFTGVSVGAGVIISQYFGAHDEKKLHCAIETTMAVTFFFSVLFTIIGCSMVPFMLRLMSTPDDVLPSASLYLRIYFSGISGLLIYNMGSAILRAVGDTKHPLLFLCISSLTNVVLDLLFVISFHMGIAGVGYATILSQFFSALLVLYYLTHTSDIYRFVWRDMKVDKAILKQIFVIGLPTGIQSAITCFSNVFVQSYINSFGASCMAGWSCYTKIDQFIILPMQSMGQAVTTFVGQNTGSGDIARAKKGTYVGLAISIFITITGAVLLWLFASDMVRLFTQDTSVIQYGVLFMRLNMIFITACCFNQLLAGALRGVGDARTPMFIMLLSFVLFRQIYLFIATRIVNSPLVVGFGYPAGWLLCSSLLIIYYRFSKWDKKLEAAKAASAKRSQTLDSV